ncbi:MAG: elongation factor G, partial [Ruminococcaceae bacterium]|nr:elongation factor G [Oscillospiraceae bacterium]
IPKAFFINKCDDPEADFDRVFKGLHAKFGNALCPVFIPVRSGNNVVMVDLMDMRAYEYDSTGARTEVPMSVDFATLAAQYKDAFNEAIAQTSDELLDKYFNGDEITHDEAVEALHTGIITGAIVPVYCGSSVKMWGIRALLDAIDHSFPRHTAKKTEKIVVGDEIKPIEINPEGDTALFVFKTVVDPFVGKMSFFKVMNGTLKKETTLKNATSGANEKIAKIYTVRGKKQTEVNELACGDIGMLAKLSATNTGDTLTNMADVKYAPVNYPEPNMCMALSPQAKGDEDKISQGITKLLEEDFTVKFENNAETKQMLIYGMGDIHLDVIVSKLKSRFGTSVKLDTPIIPYRETITRSVEVEGKYKKQTGGHGQYGHVKIRFSPGEEEGLVFTESTVGGSVPKNFHPAVEKGLQEAMLKGVAGYPVVNLKADLFDGSYHDVDSSEMSFKLAASIAFKECLRQARPVLLEPVGSLKVTIPDSVVGDIMGDLNKRRGRVMGMEAAEKKAYTVIDAEVPRAEMMDYTISLRAMTQGRGKYTFRPLRYEEVPAANAQKIIDAYKATAEE